jgi:hypothetical protein
MSPSRTLDHTRPLPMAVGRDFASNRMIVMVMMVCTWNSLMYNSQYGRDLKSSPLPHTEIVNLLETRKNEVLKKSLLYKMKRSVC